MQPEVNVVDDVLSIEEAAKHPALKPFFPCESSLAWAAKSRKRNGMAAAGAIIKVNGRLRVIVPRAVAWALTQ